MTTIERCPLCTGRLEPRTNGFGLAYLECSCGYLEPIRRKADPFPTPVASYVAADGRRRQKRYTNTVGHVKHRGMVRRWSAERSEAP